MRILRLQLVVVALFIAAPCWSAPESHTYPIPVAEMTHLISAWLSDFGLQVEQEKTVQGHILLHARDEGNTWEIRLEPRSALSTVVEGTHLALGGKGGTPPDLYKYLDEYPLNPPAENSVQQLVIPEAVMAMADYTVCLQSTGQGESVDFSGFFIDEQLILSTAHGLLEGQKITVSTYAGAEQEGTILKLDFDRDLALIRIPGAGWLSISPASGRNILRIGEKVYSTGCSVKARGVAFAGTISGPPRRVGQHPLWQVFMEIHPGRSGSPVFDEQGTLVAIVKGRYRGTGTTGFLIPLETIMDFLNSYFAECNTEDIK